VEWVELVVCCAQHEQIMDVRYCQEECGDWRMLVVPRTGLPQLFDGDKHTPVVEILRAFTRVLTGAEVSSA